MRPQAWAPSYKTPRGVSSLKGHPGAGANGMSRGGFESGVEGAEGSPLAVSSRVTGGERGWRDVQ